MRELFRRSDELRYSGRQNGNGTVAERNATRSAGTNRQSDLKCAHHFPSFSFRRCALPGNGAPPARADADATFAKANADYAAGHFPAAIAGYESLVKSRQWNPSLFYDLGNAYFRTGDFGRAILNYERALALDPAQPEARANLQLARDQARALELARLGGRASRLSDAGISMRGLQRPPFGVPRRFSADSISPNAGRSSGFSRSSC